MPAPESISALLADLDPVERTLLVPLVARAWGHRWHLDAAWTDTSAEQVLSHLDWGDVAWVPDPVTLGLVLWRTQRLCEWGQAHFAMHPTALGLNVGAGLSDYFQWLNNGSNTWADVDRSCVMQIRSQCMPTHARVHALSLDVCDEQWWAQVQPCVASNHEPMWVMLEGLLVYLPPANARRVLRTVAEHAPAGSSLAFDVIPRWMEGWPIRVPVPASPAAKFQWGIGSVDELEALHERLHLEQMESSPVPWSVWPWVNRTGWNACSPCALVRMSVS